MEENGTPDGKQEVQPEQVELETLERLILAHSASFAEYVNHEMVENDVLPLCSEQHLILHEATAHFIRFLLSQGIQVPAASVAPHDPLQ